MVEMDDGKRSRTTGVVIGRLEVQPLYGRLGRLYRFGLHPITMYLGALERWIRTVHLLGPHVRAHVVVGLYPNSIVRVSTLNGFLNKFVDAHMRH